MSKEFRRTPAEILFVKDEFTAWSLNRAVYMFGSEMEADLDRAEQNTKSKSKNAAQRAREMCFRKWMTLGREEDQPAKKFADPALKFKPKE